MRNHWRYYFCLTLLYSLLIFPSTCREIKYMYFNCKNHELQLQKQLSNSGEKIRSHGKYEVDHIARRILRGLGSSPPRCASKCGQCTPCKPVHIPVPPGTPVTAEYYPEAWRCQCGNRLYMP